MTTTTTPELAREFFALSNSNWIPHAIYAAAELGVADALGDARLHGDEVATRIEAHTSATTRLLRALATLGMVEQDDAGAFALTPLGGLLRGDRADSLRSAVLMRGSPSAQRAWAELPRCVRTGATAGKLLSDSDEPFEGSHAPDADLFNRAMAEGARQMAPAITAAYDFTGVHTVVDVGGGYGALDAYLLEQYPSLTATVFDLPRCAEGAARYVDSPGRFAFVGGDFFHDEVPSGADVYVLKHVLHDWDDARAAAILVACRRAMRADSRLLVIETVVPEVLGPTPSDRWIATADLTTLVATGGCERTEREFRHLLATAHLGVGAIAPTKAGASVIEAHPTD